MKKTLFLIIIFASLFLWYLYKKPHFGIKTYITKDLFHTNQTPAPLPTPQTVGEPVHTKEADLLAIYNNEPEKWADWKYFNGSNDVYQKNINSILDNVIGIKQTDSAQVKSEKITQYVVKRLSPYEGKSRVFQFASAYEMWLAINKGTVPVACYEYSTIYAMFATHAGLPSRVIFVDSHLFGQLIQHSVAESYDEQTKQWFMVDPTYRISMINQSANLSPITTYEYLDKISHLKPTDSLPYAFHFLTHTTQLDQPLSESDYLQLHDQQKYFTTDTLLTFTTPTGKKYLIQTDK